MHGYLLWTFVVSTMLWVTSAQNFHPRPATSTMPDTNIRKHHNHNGGYASYPENTNIRSQTQDGGYNSDMPMRRGTNVENRIKSEQEWRRTQPEEECLFGLCESVSNYPDSEIQLLVNNSIQFKQYFEPVRIDNRNKFADEGETLCAVKSHTLYPKTAKNLQKEEKTIVNVDGAKQGVLVETCMSMDQNCSYTESFPQGYKTSCKQKFLIRRLMVLNDSKQLVFDSFEIPSCCVCTIEKVKT